jgi:hypothetical protein
LDIMPTRRGKKYSWKATVDGGNVGAGCAVRLERMVSKMGAVDNE